MAIKIRWEWCLEVLSEYEKGLFEIIDSDHAEVGDKSYNLEHLLSRLDDHIFYFGIKRWSFDTEIEDADWEHIYLSKAGIFYGQWNPNKEYSLPKYVMKEVESHMNKIINHKNFMEEEG